MNPRKYLGIAVSAVAIMAISALTGLTLTACGGGEPIEDQGASVMGPGIVALQTAPDVQRRTLAAAAAPTKAKKEASIGAVAAMAWLERRFPELFSNGTALQTLQYEGATYVVRHYPGSNIYIAVSGGTLYALGAFTGNQVQAFGPAWLVACTIDGVDCPASVNVDPVVPKARNACAPPSVLKPGDASVSVYRYSGSVSGQVTFTSEVGAATLLQGQTVLPIEFKTSGSLSNGRQTVPVLDWIISYESTDARGTTRRLGELREQNLTDASGATTTTVTQYLFNPSLPDSEFTMQPGESLVKSTSRTSTQVEPTAQVAVTSAYTETFTFKNMETITVIGRSYQTCRYVNQETGGSQWTRWYEVGTGKIVRQSLPTTRSQAGVLIELES